MLYYAVCLCGNASQCITCVCGIRRNRSESLDWHRSLDGGHCDMKSSIYLSQSQPLHLPLLNAKSLARGGDGQTQ